MEHCLTSCERKTIHNNWRVLAKEGGKDKLSVILQNAVVLEEFHIYSFNCMLADIGGSLGLFVGISFLSLWNPAALFSTAFFKYKSGKIFDCICFKLNPT